MANVWLARMPGKHGFEKLLAVKTILTNEIDNESFKDMFLDEARLASRIDHPSVVRVTDVGEYIGVPYLVMELIEGEALDKLVRTAEKSGVRLPVGVALRIVADACHGLQAAHELKDADGASLHVVHRDISPQNILVTTAGVAKIIDFGIAKARDRSAGPTTTGTLKGKISYMPREQALGKEVDARADTWALGAVLYYALAGRPPYKGETQLATLRMAMNGAAIEPLPTTIPALVRSFVNKALKQDIAGRFQTAAEMGEALEQLIRRLGTVTTHAETGAFVKTVMQDKIEARKQLVQHALAEAAHRERSGVDITIPGALEMGDQTSVESGMVAAANIARTLSSGQSQPPDESGISNTVGTVGTFAAPPYERPRVPLWHSIALVVIALMGAVGIVLLIAVLVTRNGSPAQAAGPSHPATQPAPLTASPAIITTTAASELGGAADASAPRPPATGVSNTPVTPSTINPVVTPRPVPVAPTVQQPSQAAQAAQATAQPARPVTTVTGGTKTSPPKKRDDEAGF